MGSIQDREPYILNYLIEFQNSIWLSCFGGYRKQPTFTWQHQYFRNIS